MEESNMEVYVSIPTDWQAVLISKIVKIPREKWNFSSNTADCNHFYVVSDDFRYAIYVSGGTVSNLRIQSSANYESLIEINSNDELQAFANSLMDELQKARDFKKMELVKKVEENLHKIMQSI